jgi:competence protein ComEA
MLLTDHLRSHPPLLFGVAVFAAVALLLSRGSLPKQASPAFSLPAPAGVQVLLGEGFANPGVHQFSDGITVRGVIELTDLAPELSGGLPGVDLDAGLVDGMALQIADSAARGRGLEQSWMPARQRLALGIPLHPDRMSRDDWQMLPGIGEKLAAQIEVDRQKYGDFGSFEALDRVKGIGPAKLKALRPFFVSDAKSL